eukprot:TRINITY_DN3923_c0_g1_i1.p1 TRINITY_DN3923_c0_g1~~TRINITY_DN3923_c0_g1_i1.p1  ORF type:complete len:113 (+),score=21.81 TRINITY_DN3923_c0_g1_i1:121-459(+)
MKVIDTSSLHSEGVSHNPDILKHVMLRKGDIQHINQFATSIIPYGKEASKHKHTDMSEVFFVLKGRGLMVVDEREIELKEGMCVAVEPEEFHEIRNNVPDQDLVLLYFGVQM